MFIYALLVLNTYITLYYIVYIIDAPPDISCMQCVPATWCVRTKVAPSKIWDDTGAGGGKPGSIWTVNSMDMVAAVPGHEPPPSSDPGYEFISPRFYIGERCRLMPDGSLKFA